MPITDSPKLTSLQGKALDGIYEWLAEGDRPDYRLAGYAGTGKSTLVSQLVNVDAPARKLKVAAASFTGKAASVLRRKGIVEASTIHTLIYYAEEDATGRTQFFRKDDIDADLIVIDEAHTVYGQLYEDLMAFKKPVLFVGDNAQLEPIGDNPSIMERSDFTLDEVHRQALKNPIIRYATLLRQQSDDASDFAEDHGGEHLRLGGWKDLLNAFETHDQVICGFNKTRVELNDAYRNAKDYDDLVHVGERVICLKNNRKVGVFNGMICEVVAVNDVKGPAILLDVKTELGEVKRGVIAVRKQFGNGDNAAEDRDPRLPQNATYWDYAYAITCHKALGSEWNKVAVFEQIYKWNPWRWRYTAATRAAVDLLYCTR